MRKILLLAVFLLLLIVASFENRESAWAGEYPAGPVPNQARPCGSYGIGNSECVPDGDQICSQWFYNSGSAEDSPDCVPAEPEGGVKTWAESDGQNCRQFVNPDGSPQSSVACWWPTKQIPAGENSQGWKCYAQEYTAGPDEGLLTPGPRTCPDPNPSNTYQKTWVNP